VEFRYKKQMKRGIKMYKIEKLNYGYKLTFSGNMKLDELMKWQEESKIALANQTGSFGVIIDMRTLSPLMPDAQKCMEEGQQLYKTKGMNKSAVILNSPVVTMQFKRLAKQSGIASNERYIDSSKDASWEKTAIDWIEKGIDTDN
jgi:hypothetical protein